MYMTFSAIICGTKRTRYSIDVITLKPALSYSVTVNYLSHLLNRFIELEFAQSKAFTCKHRSKGLPATTKNLLNVCSLNFAAFAVRLVFQLVLQLPLLLLGNASLSLTHFIVSARSTVAWCSRNCQGQCAVVSVGVQAVEGVVSKHP